MQYQEGKYWVMEWEERKIYQLNGPIHRDGDLPAIEYKTGAKFWYQYGKRHRENDLPAIEYAKGNKVWLQN